jgi:flagellar hook-basal body complex protein FliE
MNPISGPSLPPAAPTAPSAPSASDRSARAPSAGPAAPSFRDVLIEGIEQVNNMQQDADAAVEQLMTGQEVDPAVVLTAVQKADMSFRMMTQIRNKLMQAYQEIKEIRI